MNELKAYNERIASYKSNVSRLKTTKESLVPVINMSEVEKTARTEYINDSIEMFEEKISILEDKILAFMGLESKLSNDSFTECNECGYIVEGEANNYCKSCNSFNTDFYDRE